MECGVGRMGRSASGAAGRPLPDPPAQTARGMERTSPAFPPGIRCSFPILYVAGTHPSPVIVQSTQVDFVSLLRRIHSLVPRPLATAPSAPLTRIPLDVTGETDYSLQRSFKRV
jgi:hypothetical protein